MAHGSGGQAVDPGTGRGESAWRPGEDPVTWLLLILATVATAAVYPQLPEQMPIRWNLAGKPNSWAPRALVAWLGLGVAAGTNLLMSFLPALDPRRESYPRFAGAYRLARQSIVLTLLGVHAVTVLVGLGIPVAVERVAPLAVGILAILLGNVMGQVRRNYFFGIRTPWTLADDEVWRRTHRMGGRLFVLGGLLCVAGALAGGVWAVAGVVVGMLGSAAGSGVYSYRVWKELQGREGRG